MEAGTGRDVVTHEIGCFPPPYAASEEDIAVESNADVSTMSVLCR